MTRMFYRGASCVFLVYDVTRIESLNNALEYWLNEVRDHASPKDLVMVYLIGNKAELDGQRQVSLETVIDLACSHKITKRRNMIGDTKPPALISKCFETSALTGDNVSKVFEYALKEVYLAISDRVN